MRLKEQLGIVSESLSKQVTHSINCIITRIDSRGVAGERVHNVFMN